MHFDRAGPGERLQRHDRRHQFHAVVGGCRPRRRKVPCACRCSRGSPPSRQGQGCRSTRHPYARSPCRRSCRGSTLAQFARQLERHVLLAKRHLFDGDIIMRAEGIDDLVDQHFRRRSARRDADSRKPGERGQSSSWARCTSKARGQPFLRPTSTSRLEFDEFGAPTTSSMSISWAIDFTASWRLVVA